MDKLNRRINPEALEASKHRTMTAVMDKIQERERRSSVLRRLVTPALVPAFILIFALVIVFSPGATTPDDGHGDISAYESERLAEISYLSASFIGADLTVSDPLFRFLNDTDTTQFETNDETINFYFDTLRVFLDEDAFAQSIAFTELEDSEFDYLITFDINGIPHEFYLVIIDGEISGQLVVNAAVFLVTGSYEETDTETTIEINAVRGDDHVIIRYSRESDEDLETKYEVQTRINGIETERNIKLSIEDDEAKVDIEEGDNSYQLKKEAEDGVIEYKLEYTLNGVSGQARITETTDAFGQPLYSYQVQENGKEVEVTRGRPNYDYDDNPGNNDDDNPGNNDDNPGNSDDNPGNSGNPSNNPSQQSYDQESDLSKNIA